MSSEARSQAVPEPRSRLGYLFKHAQRRLAELYAVALAPHGVDGTEWAVLLVLAAGGATSQQHLARQLEIDRTTMVALLDALQTKKLVTRHPHPQDRRRNVVELTVPGRDTLDRATQAADSAESAFLAPLTHRQAQQLSDTLHALIAANQQPPLDHPHPGDSG